MGSRASRPRARRTEARRLRHGADRVRRVEARSLLADRTQGPTDPDDAPAVPEHPVSRTGDLWIMGRHRLLCGDSTVAMDVERVLGGHEAHLMGTDPPHGVMLDPSWRDRAGINTMGKAGGGGENYMESGQ